MERIYIVLFRSLSIKFFVGLFIFNLSCSRHTVSDIPSATIDHDGAEILSIEGSFQVSGPIPCATVSPWVRCCKLLATGR